MSKSEDKGRHEYNVSVYDGYHRESCEVRGNTPASAARKVVETWRDAEYGENEERVPLIVDVTRVDTGEQSQARVYLHPARSGNHHYTVEYCVGARYDGHKAEVSRLTWWGSR